MYLYMIYVFSWYKMRKLNIPRRKSICLTEIRHSIGQEERNINPMGVKGEIKHEKII